MIKDIWHTGKKILCGDQYVVVKHLSGLYSVGPAFEYDIGDYEKWAYFDDLLALETELERTRKALDVAMGFIEKVRNNEDTNMFWIKVANDTINKITALEQKDE